MMKELIWLVIGIVAISGSSCEKKLPVVDNSIFPYQTYYCPAFYSPEEGDTLLVYYFNGAGDPYNKSGIYLYDLNKGEGKKLFDRVAAAGIDFSPDGQWLVFSAHYIIWKTPLEGDTVIFLAADPNGVGCFFPDWSPDGQKIAFDIPGVINGGIFLMNPDGSNRERLIKMARDPAWSPDGNRLYYQKWATEEDSDTWSNEIFYYDFATGEEKRLTYLHHDYTSEPSVSPSGEKVAFTSQTEQRQLPQVWVMGKDGENLHQITNEGGCNPVFYSDSVIVYAKVKQGDGRLWKIGVDGQNNELFLK